MKFFIGFCFIALFSICFAVELEGTQVYPNPSPLTQMKAHAVGIHFASGDITRQDLVHHYCNEVQGVHQCVLFDSVKPNARMIGIEYFVNAHVFNSFPESEKKYWHSHDYEVKSGMLVFPGLQGQAEMNELTNVAQTYGKTFQFWQNENDAAPMGIPHLMMGMTKELQPCIHRNLLTELDVIAGSNLEDRAQKRASIPLTSHHIPLGADAWKSGLAIQLTAHEIPFQLQQQCPNVKLTDEQVHQFRLNQQKYQRLLPQKKIIDNPNLNPNVPNLPINPNVPINVPINNPHQQQHQQ